MSVASAQDLVGRRSASAVLRALIAEARRRARRRRRFRAILALMIVAAAVVFYGRDSWAGATAPRDSVVITTKWVETLPFSTHKGFVRMYVRKLEFTPTTWRAWVGLTNASGKRVYVITTAQMQHSGAPRGDEPTWTARPGIWWQTYHPSGEHWLPGHGVMLSHVAPAASIKPAYPKQLAPRASWFGVFSGPRAKLTKNRLMRIGFGVLDPRGASCGTVMGAPCVFEHRLLVSTEHQLKQPR